MSERMTAGDTRDLEPLPRSIVSYKRSFDPNGLMNPGSLGLD